MNKNEEFENLAAFGNIMEIVDTIYKQQYLLAEYSSIPRDYGNGYLMTEVEAHTLGLVHDQIGITVTKLARDTHRTKGGISKLISKLEVKGLVKRSNEPGNKRTYRLYLTEAGEQACQTHRDYDRIYMQIMLKKLLKECTEAEIIAFIKVMNCRNRIIDKQLDE